MSVHDYSAYWLPAREERDGLSRAVAWRRAEWNDLYMQNRAEREERDWWRIHKTKESPSMAYAVNPKQVRAVADGKVPLEYLEPALEVPLAHVMKHGADKYGLRNYRDTPCKISTYVGAIRRHTLAWQQGEDIDPDSGQPHLAHIAACCAVMLGAEEAGTRVDDRTEKFSTQLSDRVHADGDMDAKAGRDGQARYTSIDELDGAEVDHSCECGLTLFNCGTRSTCPSSL